MNNQKLYEIDILRAISALAVITIHVTGYFIMTPVFSNLQISVAYIDNLSGFAVPTFIFISGLVLFKNYNKLNGKVTKFYSKRFAKIVPIYLLFSFGYFLLHLIIDKQSDMGTNADMFLLIIYKLTTGGAFYHLWYFGILFQFYFLYPLLLNLYNRYKLKFLLSSLLIQFLWNYFDHNIGNNIGRILGFENLPFPLLFSHVFWFISGFYFLENKARILKLVKIKIGIIIILILGAIKTLPLYYGLQLFSYESIPREYFYSYKVVDLFLFSIEILIVYKVSILISNKKGKMINIMKAVGVYSLEIYLIHALIIILLFQGLKTINLTPATVLFYPIMWLGTISFSYILAVFYRVIKKLIHKYTGIENYLIK